MMTVKMNDKTQVDEYFDLFIMVSPNISWYDQCETVVWPDALTMPDIREIVSDMAADGVDVSDIQIFPIDIDTCFHVDETIKIKIS